MSQRAAGGGSVGIEAACAAAEERARRLGHALGPWSDESDESAVARRATCTICGAVVYVRVEDGLAGAAGKACSEPCPGRSLTHGESMVEPAASDAEAPTRA